jgi:hypothetical protein
MRPITRITLLLIAPLIGLPVSTFAQIKDVGTFLSTGGADGEKLLEAYMTPYLNAFGASLTGGWYNTAKPHKLGGFDLTASINTAIAPKSAMDYTVDELGLEGLKRAPATEPTSPTIAGSSSSGPLMQYNLPGYSADAFNLPKGTGNKYLPSPMLQLGVGLIKGTELIGRLMPTYSYDGNKVQMWGIGFKHSISQWIPFLKKLPVLDVSVMGGYTNLKGSVNLSVKPSDIGAGSLPQEPAITSTTWDNQQMKLEANSYTANLIVSANLRVICFYGGIGFATTETYLKMNGNYPLVALDVDQPTVYANANPIDFKVKNQDGGITKPRYNLGMRLKMAVVTIHVDYTRANYNVISAGLGITFR